MPRRNAASNCPAKCGCVPTGSISENTLMATARQPVTSKATVNTRPHRLCCTPPLRPTTGTQNEIAPTLPATIWAATNPWNASTSTVTPPSPSHDSAT